MMEYLFKAISVILGIYALVPTFLARVCHLGVVWRVPEGKGRVAITFDDGPDPYYTPRVLDILRRYNVKACFFVLGSKAAAYPELLKQIVDEGHEIGSHGYHHRFPWLLGPRATAREVMKAARAIEEAVGRPPALFRPPWGLFNVFSFFTGRLSGHRVVLWSFMSWDWGKLATADSIARKVLSNAADGNILVFHDSDTAPGAARGAPEQMLAALPLVLEGLTEKGLQIAPITALTFAHANQPGRIKGWLKRIWSLWELLFERLAQIEGVIADGRPTLFRLALRRYRGPLRALPDGTVIKEGDTVAELHFNNSILEKITVGNTTPEKIAIMTIREARRSLPALAHWVENNPRYRQAKALMGLTMIHRGTERLGFTTFDLSPGLMRRLVSAYQSWLLVLFHPAGRHRIKEHRDKLTPKLVIISRDRLIKQYLNL